ncbi:hypothetical protein MCOR25_007706 [Pyricularia grisea]|nr:hypothetical protein MCOR25_007706 [Pyricularia grisea]
MSSDLPAGLQPLPKVYYSVDIPHDLPDGPFDFATGRGLQPVVPFPDDVSDQTYGVGLARPIVTQTTTNEPPPTQDRILSLRSRRAQPHREAPAPNDLVRFLEAQNNNNPGYETALQEMRAGAKRSHWIWYIFPQLTGIASRPTFNNTRYSVHDLAEAVEYLRHPVLGKRLREMVDIVAASQTTTASSLMGSGVDALKLQSCMTLFRRAEAVLYAEMGYAVTLREDRYWAVLKKYYGEEECQKTVQILG